MEIEKTIHNTNNIGLFQLLQAIAETYGITGLSIRGSKPKDRKALLVRDLTTLDYIRLRATQNTEAVELLVSRGCINRITAEAVVGMYSRFYLDQLAHEALTATEDSNGNLYISRNNAITRLESLWNRHVLLLATFLGLSKLFFPPEQKALLREKIEENFTTLTSIKIYS